jgi:hypothetical protein
VARAAALAAGTRSRFEARCRSTGELEHLLATALAN